MESNSTTLAMELKRPWRASGTSTATVAEKRAVKVGGELPRGKPDIRFDEGANEKRQGED
ncbi:hypothetical protein ACFL0Q_08245 [Thermodesulfobacteriota bacterium]